MMKTLLIALITVALLTVVRATTINYTYDASGRLTSAGYGASNTITYAYDANGNLTQRSVTSDDPTPTPTPTSTPTSTLKTPYRSAAPCCRDNGGVKENEWTLNQRGWSRLSDSNRGPADYKSAALPTELSRPPVRKRISGKTGALSGFYLQCQLNSPVNRARFTVFSCAYGISLPALEKQKEGKHNAPYLLCYRR